MAICRVFAFKLLSHQELHQTDKNINYCIKTFTSDILCDSNALPT